MIVMTAFGTVEEAVRAMKEGAADFLTKPVDTDHLLLLLDRAIERRRAPDRARCSCARTTSGAIGLPRVLGEDPALKETMLAIQRAAATDATVLLLGESGTGKELMSRALHQLSPRAKGPFVAINCAAIPETLLENELFGHEKGAFTGATARKLGKAEMAHHGTLFLDEIGDLPLPLQAKILRLVQERQFERVGGVQTLTRGRAGGGGHQPRPEGGGGAEGVPRGPLLPALRVPRGDPAPAPAARRHPAPGRGVPRALRPGDGAQGPEALGGAPQRALLDHSWPGNVRELQNCLERAVILVRRAVVEPEHLRIGVAGPAARPGARRRDSTSRDRSPRWCGGRLSGPAEEAIALALREREGDRAAAASRWHQRRHLGPGLSLVGR